MIDELEKLLLRIGRSIRYLHWYIEEDGGKEIFVGLSCIQKQNEKEKLKIQGKTNIAYIDTLRKIERRNSL